jgi:hypothetical protein
MGFVPISQVARIGIVKDLDDHRLPPEAWTDGRNIRFEDNKVKRSGGHSRVMNPPTVAPGFVANFDNGGDSFWMYASAVGAGSKVYVFNDGTHTDISQAGNYTVDDYRQWNSTNFQGIPILNYGTDTPQYWADFNVATDLADITGWPANTTAKVIRAFKNYLIGLNIADGTGSFFHRVIWSDGADPGTLPASWTESDTSDAGSNDLSDTNSGQIYDGETLGGFFVIYKGESTWLMRYIGGTLIMGFEQKLQSSGVLATRCVTPLTLPLKKDQVHCLHNGSDFGIFNGQAFESVIEKKVRKYLNANIDSSDFVNAFVFDHPTKDECWFAYPEQGAVNPNVAMIWNYRDNTVTFRDFVGTSAAYGRVESAISMFFDDASAIDFDDADDLFQPASIKKQVVADQANTKLQELENGTTFDGSSFTAVFERTGLAVIGQDRDGNPIVDYNQRKVFYRVWPNATGGPIEVAIGGTEEVGGTVTWGPYSTYTPGSGTPFIDCATDDGEPVNTRFMAIKFRWSTDVVGELAGYSIEPEVVSYI